MRPLDYAGDRTFFGYEGTLLHVPVQILQFIGQEHAQIL